MQDNISEEKKNKGRITRDLIYRIDIIRRYIVNKEVVV